MTLGPILVTLDGSAPAEAALPPAVTLAQTMSRRIDVLAVVEPLAGVAGAARLAPLVADGLRAYLNATVDGMKDAGTQVTACIRHGDPAEVILAHAAEHDVSLIVMTTRGAGGLDRWMVGSVADEVMRRASCPVLLLPFGASQPQVDAAWRPRRLLVPLDGSPLAEQSLPLAYLWAAALGAELLLARVQPWVTQQLAAADGYVPNLATLDDEAVQAAGSYLEEQRKRCPPEIPVRIFVPRGNAAAGLTALAEQEQVDLVILTSHGRGGFRRLVLGSVADRLVRGGLPVCIVHPGTTDSVRSEAPETAGITA